jgi:hypothetical protein
MSEKRIRCHLSGVGFVLALACASLLNSVPAQSAGTKFEVSFPAAVHTGARRLRGERLW